MPKRPLSQPTTASPKRPKSRNNRNQPDLLSFFSTSTSNAAHEHPPPPSKVILQREVIDVDALEHTVPCDPTLPAAPVAGPSHSKMSVHIRVSKDTVLAVPDDQDLSVDPLMLQLSGPLWRSKHTPYFFLSSVLKTLAGTKSRIKIINTLTNCFRILALYDSSSLVPALYLLSNTLSPPYIPIELGIGPSVISKAIQHVSGGLSPAALKALYVKTGDMGDAAFEAKSRVSTLVPHEPLSVRGVYDILLKIASAKGTGAVKQKQQLVEKLLLSARGEETRFLVRTLSLNLRVGAVETSILTALARAMVLIPPSNETFLICKDSLLHVTSEHLSQVHASSPSKKGKAGDLARQRIIENFINAEHSLKRVFVQHPNYETIVEIGLKHGGLDDLESRVPLTVCIPLHPTLGTPTRSLDEINDKVADVSYTAEFKYDGQRAQVHGYKDASGTIGVSIFSRHLEDMTSKYPDVVSLIQRQFEHSDSLESFIMDSEVVAVDPISGELKSFQELSNRARKDVQLNNIQVSIAIFAFDLMYFNGESLLKKPFRLRRDLLRSKFQPVNLPELGLARFGYVESCDSDDGPDAIENFWAKALESRCEGLMIKILDNKTEPVDGAEGPKSRRKLIASAHYEADKRTSSWLKLKKDYVAGLGDTLDLVPIGAWHGNGRKAKFWSPILLGIRDSDTDQLYAVCKCMSGFTDTFYQEVTKRYALTEGNEDNCSLEPLWGGEFGGLRPPVYFRPQEVWEIRGADITISPVAPAAMGLISDARGLSLRFPRFIRVRDDKSIGAASDTRFLAQLWQKQQGVTKVGGTDEGDLVDADFEEEEQFSELDED